MEPSPFDWAKAARQMAKDSQGSVLPTHLEHMTLDQVLVLVLPDSEFGVLTRATPSEAVKAGHVDPKRILPQSKAARIREQAKAAQAQKRRKRRRQRG